MSTAELVGAAKSMVTKVHGLRENEVVCVLCDAVEFWVTMLFPIALPFMIIFLSELP